MPALTVSALCDRIAKSLLMMPLLEVQGEVANFSASDQGHWYFTLKDSQAQLRCVFFRAKNIFSPSPLRNGKNITLRGRLGLYATRGDVQIFVESLADDGIGNLHQQFLQLKEKLEGLGWFADDRKKNLPYRPQTVGIITSKQADALIDVVRTIERRNRSIQMLIYHTPVQGVGAAAQISALIRRANQERIVDILLLVRGGGSYEDLAAFNTEEVASAIFDSQICIVSGIGHESDFTIADSVADCRASTPTAAAELFAPPDEFWDRKLNHFHSIIYQNVQHRLEYSIQRLDQHSSFFAGHSRYIRLQIDQTINSAHSMRKQLQSKLALAQQYLLQQISGFNKPVSRLFADHELTFSHYSSRLQQSLRHHLIEKCRQLEQQSLQFSANDVQTQLNRGFTLINDENNLFITSSSQLKKETSYYARFKDGVREIKRAD